jgi:hypothetical protein
LLLEAEECLLRKRSEQEEAKKMLEDQDCISRMMLTEKIA